MPQAPLPRATQAAITQCVMATIAQGVLNDNMGVGGAEQRQGRWPSAAS